MTVKHKSYQPMPVTPGADLSVRNDSGRGRLVYFSAPGLRVLPARSTIAVAISRTLRLVRDE